MIRLNLFTKDEIEKNKFWMKRLGIPPWELMPEGEDCDTAKRLKNSYMGCLVAMSRFVLLKEDGIYYVEGIQYPSHKEGWREPSITVNEQGKSVKLLWIAKVTHRGYLKIGKAIANCYDDGNQSDQAKQKLRRLLACDSVKEACRVLRPILSLINSKSENAGGLDFVFPTRVGVFLFSFTAIQAELLAAELAK